MNKIKLKETDKTKEVDEKLMEDLSEKEKKILSILINTKKIYSSEIQDVSNISREMSNRYFNVLDSEHLENKFWGDYPTLCSSQ